MLPWVARPSCSIQDVVEVNLRDVSVHDDDVAVNWHDVVPV
jgi:hypothetical protein